MTTKVYHSENTRDTGFYGHKDIITNEAIIKMFKEGEYTLVAEVDTNDMDDVFRLTNHISHSWTENEEVTAVIERVRSTSVGDILVNDNGTFIVAGCGFEQLEVA